MFSSKILKLWPPWQFFCENFFPQTCLKFRKNHFPAFFTAWVLNSEPVLKPLSRAFITSAPKKYLKIFCSLFQATWGEIFFFNLERHLGFFFAKCDLRLKIKSRPDSKTKILSHLPGWENFDFSVCVAHTPLITKQRSPFAFVLFLFSKQHGQLEFSPHLSVLF